MTRRCLVTSPKTPPPKPRRFHSVAVAAEILDVSEVTLYRAIHAGDFPAVKVRGRYVVPAKALDQLEDEALTRWRSETPAEEPDDAGWGVA
jgi:excisionase family DNA binding protein